MKHAFLVVLSRTGPEFDQSKPLEEQTLWDEHADFMEELVKDGLLVLGGTLDNDWRTVHVFDADSEDTIRTRLAQDPWSESHLHVDAIEPWTIRLER